MWYMHVLNLSQKVQALKAVLAATAKRRVSVAVAGGR